MADPEHGAIELGLRTPRSAAIAGIIFAALFTISVVLLEVVIRADSAESRAWLVNNSGAVTFGLALVPFAGIAFLWFIGVVRDRLGRLEDQFFATVFFGSGLLFLGLSFVSAAIAAGMVSSSASVDVNLWHSDAFTMGRDVMLALVNVYAIRMAGVFMLTLATVWIRTKRMPRWIAFMTYVLAGVLLVTIDRTGWVTLVIPAWTLVVSIYILTHTHGLE
ncbi:MAG: hypothetical protein U0822_03115 [Anaerolineae bacterium]